MIKIGKKLWEHLQKKGFFTNEDNSKVLEQIYDKRMYQTRIYRWYTHGFNLPLRDVRSVFNQTNAEDKELQIYYSDCMVYTKGYLDLDKTALKVAFKVNQRLSYASDIKVYKKTEYWARPIDIHRKKVDDCDGYAVLTCYVAGLLGIPNFRRFIRIGLCEDGGVEFGHATFIYLSTKTNEFFPLEGSFYPAISFRNFDRKPLKMRKEYKNTRFMFNESHAYGVNPLIQLIK